jgi:hypothetical protein
VTSSTAQASRYASTPQPCDRSGPGSRCDIKTLAAEAGDRTVFYGNRPYVHLRVEFERRLQALQQAGERPDPRDAQITRLKHEITTLKQRLTESANVANCMFALQAVGHAAD